jgi:myo-inositol-1-phosphate synthase
MAKKNGSNSVSGNGNGAKAAGGTGKAWAGANRKDGKVRVAIVGVGNCASSLVQGRYYYENAKETDFVPGLMHVSLGGYHVRDIEFVAAFDINKTKVGKDLSEAIYAHPNNTIVFQQVPHMGVKVDRGMTHDGLGKYLSQVIEKAPGPTADIVGILKEREVDVMVSYLPVGSEEATKWYAEQAIKAGVGFVNAIPVFIGREPYWQRRFAEEGLPIIGDDIKSQVGATITHRVMTRLFMDRGVRLDRTYQLNFGGNTDFLNMLERERLESKKISKTNAVTSMLDYELEPGDVHVGPSDHVPWLTDRKFCYIQMEGTTYGDVPLRAELKLEVWDSPNSAGVITDAIRCMKLGLDRGLKGTLVAPSSYFMKSPPAQLHDDIAFNRVEAFIRGDDIKSQVGATITHRVMTRLFMDRGVRLDRTYQLNFGGNTDFLNMLERERLESKKISKTNAVTSMLDYELEPGDVHVGPSDHVPWLTDRKFCYIQMEGTTYGDVPLRAELKLEVWDSPNSAGVITDAIRCMKLGLDRGLKGTLVAPSSYFMKSPPAQLHDDIAFNRVEAFIRGDDNETLVGTEKLTERKLRTLAKAPAKVAAK